MAAAEHAAPSFNTRAFPVFYSSFAFIVLRSGAQFRCNCNRYGICLTPALIGAYFRKFKQLTFAGNTYKLGRGIAGYAGAPAA
jgi:hypothetical protein